MVGSSPEVLPPASGVVALVRAGGEGISRYSGAFLDPSLESEFRLASGPEWSHRVAVVALVAPLLILSFAYVDWRALGPGPALWTMWTLRLVLLAIGLAIARSLWHGGSTAGVDRGALTLTLSVTALILVVVFLERKGVARETPATLLGVIGFYLFVPAPLPFQVLASLTLSVGFLAAQATWGPPAPVEWASAATQFLICNALGSYTSLRNHALMRREFLGLRHARRLVVQEARHKRELQQSVAALELSNQELERFSYVASHDLQSPLRNVISFSQLLHRRLGARLDARGTEYLETIVRSAGHMQNLITDLLAFAHVGRTEPVAVDVDAGQVLDQVKQHLAAVIHERGAQVTHEPLPRVRATPLEVLQLLQNLVGNAIKFQPGEQPRVHLAAQRDGTRWEFTVRDHGVGIEARHRERIFQVFERLDTGREGTGIGLAICQKIVERHGGRIWVDSEPGQGSTFRFTLPAAAG